MAVQRYFVLFILAISVTSCVSPAPRVRPFADRTVEMVEAINAGQQSVDNVLTTTLGEDYNPANGASQGYNEIKDQKKKLAITVTILRERLKLTSDCLKAVVAYSDTLAEIADAGKKGPEAVDAVAESLERMRIVVEPLVQLPGVPQVVIASLRSANTLIANMRARKTIGQAVLHADPAIQTIATIVALNLNELKILNESANNYLIINHYLNNMILNDYYKSLVKQDQQAMNVITLINEYRQSLSPIERRQNLSALQKKDPTISDNPSVEELDNKERDILNRASLQRAELARIETTYRTLKEREQALKQQKVQTRIILDRSQELIKTWAATHSSLNVAIDQKRSVNILELVTGIQSVVIAYQLEGK